MSVDYDYDELNRLETVKDNRLPAGTDSTNYTYDFENRLTSKSDGIYIVYDG